MLVAEHVNHQVDEYLVHGLYIATHPTYYNRLMEMQLCLPDDDMEEWVGNSGCDAAD